MDSRAQVAYLQNKLCGAVDALQGVVRRYNAGERHADSQLFCGLLGVTDAKSGSGVHKELPRANSRSGSLLASGGFQQMQSYPRRISAWEEDVHQFPGLEEEQGCESEVGLSDVPIMAILAELREAQKTLDEDPLWWLALSTSTETSKDRNQQKSVQKCFDHVDWDEAMLQLAEAESREQDPKSGKIASQDLDAVDALLQFAQLPE